MNIKDIIKEYYLELDDIDRLSIDDKIAEKGIEQYLNQQLIYLDCTRIVDNLRLMQTIGYHYQREISCYIYALNQYVDDIDEHKDFTNKLIERHIANIEYEKENPPVWYSKPNKNTKRKRKHKEADIFPEETKKVKVSKAEAKLKAKFISGVNFSSFKLKKD